MIVVMTLGIMNQIVSSVYLMIACYCHGLSWKQHPVYAKNDGDMPVLTKWIKLTCKIEATCEGKMWCNDREKCCRVQLGIIESCSILLWKSCSQITLANMGLVISKKALRENTIQLTNESPSSWWKLFVERTLSS